MTTSTKRVLIYRLGSLGDTLIALPALHLVARVFPEAERRMLTNFPVNVKAPPAAAILENSGLVHGFIRYVVGTRSPLELLGLWWQLFRWRPEVLIYLGPPRGVESARRDAAFFRACGIKRLIGLPLTEDMQQNRWEQVEGALEPEGARLARNIAELGDACIDAAESWNLHLTPAETGRAREALAPVAGHPLIAVSVGIERGSGGERCQRVCGGGMAAGWSRAGGESLRGAYAAGECGGVCAGPRLSWARQRADASGCGGANPLYSYICGSE